MPSGREPKKAARSHANLNDVRRECLAPNGGATAQEAIVLPVWSPPATAPTQRFRFTVSRDKPQRKSMWRPAGPPRRYFGERLPATFERTLVVEELQSQQGGLEWVFTGELGGFTIAAGPKVTRVFQRYYDSLGLGDPVHPLKYPEKIIAESTIAYQGNVRAITVHLDSSLQLSVQLNGREVIRQKCLLDVSHHQLEWTGDEGASAGYMLTPETTEASVSVDPTQPRQTMLGFGGITIPTAYAQLSPEGKRRWWEILVEYNLLLQREFPMGEELNPEMDNWDHLEDAAAITYSDNFPDGEISDFAYLKNIRRMGGKVLFEFWGLPLWARRDWTDAQGQLHSGVADVEPYARAIVRYCQVSQERVGAPPDIVGIQNEEEQPPGIWHEMTLRLRAALDKAGLSSVKIHMRDAPRLAGGIQCAQAFRDSEAVWKDIDYAATHMYDYQKLIFDPDRFDPLLAQWRDAIGNKPFLSTELCVNDSGLQTRSYRLALGMGQLYHKNLVLANASALFYCWLLLNVEQPSYGWTRTLFVPDPAHGYAPTAPSYQTRVFGAFSRRVRAGMVRLEAQASNPDVLASAFVGNQGARTLILLNRSVTPQRIQIDWKGKPFRFLEWVSPYAENTVTPAPSSVQIVVPPGAIATLATEELGRLDFTPEGLVAG
jgi:O-glycosyl hydrolase